jgi:hypothetical protein
MMNEIFSETAKVSGVETRVLIMETLVLIMKT